MIKNYYPPYSTSFGDRKDIESISETIFINRPYNSGGLPIFSDGNRINVLTGDTHGIIMGGTGSKKTRSIAYPFIFNIASAKNKQSMVVHDTKGNVPEYTYNFLRSQGYEVYIINWRNPACSDHFNPLDLVTDLMKKGEKTKALMRLGDIGNQLITPTIHNENDRFWEYTLMSYHDRLYRAVYKLCNGSRSKIHYSNMVHLHNYLKNNYSTVKSMLVDMDESEILAGLSAIWDNARETRSNLISMADNAFKIFDSVSDITYKSSFNVRDLIKKPVCVFIVTPDESKEFNVFVSLMIKAIYSELIDISSEYEGMMLPRRVNFFIDEFGTLPLINDFDSIISASRSRNMRFFMICQTFSQLRSVYSEEVALSILNNCEAILCFRSNDPEIEDFLRLSTGNRMLPYSGRELPLIPNGTLRTLEKGEAVILIQGLKNPLKIKFPDITEYPYPFAHSDCMTQKRKNRINLSDFGAMTKKDDEEEDEETNEKNMDDAAKSIFLFRKEKLEELRTKHDTPQVVFNFISYLDKVPEDVIIRGIKYGYEIDVINALTETGLTEHDAITVTDKAARGDRIMIRCVDAKQAEKLICKIHSICQYDVFPLGKKAEIGATLRSRYSFDDLS
ncbi:MAG: hypothetical protein E7514_01915 [Ruminococcaceae bacterium]|nr:hypothetical protein [Oscillospiraceae bacterium]